MIRQVIPNGPAAGAGFAPGDVINSINGQPVNSATALTAILDQHHPGDNVQVGEQPGMWAERLSIVCTKVEPKCEL